MAVAKQFKQLSEIHQGNTAATNLKMLDHIPMQHEDTSSSTNNLGRLRFAQLMCTPFATAGNHSSGTYSATVSNYPDFSIKYQDLNGNDHYLVGMKVRVKFNNGITYGSVSGGTYPLLNIGGTGALPLLAQGMPMASGAATSGQTLEFTLIPYGNNYAWDADSNVRESTSDYTIYTDGTIGYTQSGCNKAIGWSAYIASTTNVPILQLKNSVFGSDTERSMLVTAYVKESTDYWVGVVFWRQGIAGGEGDVFKTISNKGLSITYINQLGNVAYSENCIFRARAI